LGLYTRYLLQVRPVAYTRPNKPVGVKQTFNRGETHTFFKKYNFPVHKKKLIMNTRI